MPSKRYFSYFCLRPCAKIREQESVMRREYLSCITDWQDVVARNVNGSLKLKTFLPVQGRTRCEFLCIVERAFIFFPNVFPHFPRPFIAVAFIFTRLILRSFTAALISLPGRVLPSDAASTVFPRVIRKLLTVKLVATKSN